MLNVTTIDEIAEALKLTRPYAVRKIRILQERHNFPRPLPGVPGRFSRSQVEAWIAGGGAAVAAEPVTAAAPGDAVAAARTSLEARYVGH